MIPATPPSLTGTPAVFPTTGTSAGRNERSDFETFLVMLTTQLRHQDPLNPMEATDFAVQLATFSGVEQQVRTNQLLEGMLSQTALAELAGLVGMTARAAVPARYDGQPITVAIDLPPDADSAQLVVRNAMGGEVDRILLDPARSSLDWRGLGPDGMPLPDGLYSFDVVSQANGTILSTAPAEVYAPVVEARRNGASTVLVLSGGVEVDAGKVTALRADR